MSAQRTKRSVLPALLISLCFPFTPGVARAEAQPPLYLGVNPPEAKVWQHVIVRSLSPCPMPRNASGQAAMVIWNGLATASVGLQPDGHWTKPIVVPPPSPGQDKVVVEASCYGHLGAKRLEFAYESVRVHVYG